MFAAGSLWLLRRAWCAGVFALLFWASAAQALTVAVVSPSGTEAYERFSRALLQSQSLGAVSFEPLSLDALGDAGLARADVVVAVGARAAQGVLASSMKKPVLAVMLSENSYQALVSKYPQAELGGIVLDQPAFRQLALFRALWPEGKNLGLLLGAPGSATQSAFEKAAERLGLRLKHGFLMGARGSVPVLEALMDGSEAILAPPDRDAFNAENARVILLTTYRAGVPLLAYSSSAVDAGALAAVFSTPESQARQVAEWLAAQSSSAVKLPAQREPKYFEIAINHQVARSLKLDVPDVEIVLQRMREVKP